MSKRVSWKWVLVGIVIVGLSLTVACGKKNAAEQAMEIAKSMTHGMVPTSAQNDYTKPYLTEEKMQKFIESLKEEINPFEVVFKGGQGGNLMDLKNKLEEYNAYAKKYGFADYADYMAVWGRITVGQLEIASQEMTKSSVKMMEDSIKTAEENLKKPDLSSEMKSMYEEQIKSSQKSLEEMQKPSTSGKTLNDDDMALVLKYKAQIEEATKKFKEAKQNPQ
jgi:hypothetical protein